MLLAELQRQFCAALLLDEAGDTVNVIAGDNISIADRLAVYRNNVFSNLRNALEETFPAVKVLVGEGFFRSLSHDYIRQYPPRQAALLYYGDTFPEFIAAYAPAAGLPYLADVARLEWACQEVLQADSDIAADPVALSFLDEEGLGAFAPWRVASVRLVKSGWPVDAIRVFTQQPDASPPDMDAGPVWLLIRRKEHEARIVRLQPWEYAGLSAIDGRVLANVCEDVLDRFPQADIPAFLAMLFQESLLQGGKS